MKLAIKGSVAASALAMAMAMFLPAGTAMGQDASAPSGPMARPAADALAAKPILAEVEMRGTGEIDLILVPGLACDWTVWESFMDRNKDRYTMHAVTLAGFGGTEPVSKPDLPLDEISWLDAAVESLAAHIRKHELEKPYIVGHSLGGMVVFKMAVEHGDLIGGAISIDGLPAYPIRDGSMGLDERRNMVDQMLWAQLRAMTPEAWTAQQRMILDSEIEDKAVRERYRELMSETPAPVAGRYLAELMRQDMRPRFSEAKAPVAVLVALNDHAAARGFGKERLRAFWLDSMANAKKTQIRFVDDAGHFLMDEHPAVVDETIERFTSGQSIATGGDAAQKSERATPEGDGDDEDEGGK